MKNTDYITDGAPIMKKNNNNAVKSDNYTKTVKNYFN